MLSHPRIFLLTTIAVASAHLEDYCTYNTSVRSKASLENFFKGSAGLDCDYKSWRPGCVAATLKVEASTFQNVSPCRGAVHFDSVYIVASAIGMLPEYAYWTAAFSQGIDFVQFAPTDSCGNWLPLSLWTPPLRGLMRTSAATGGSLRHLGLPWGKTATDARHPNLTDTVTEGTLASYRRWARGETAQLCTNGFTEAVDGVPFGGSRCADGWMLPNPNKIVQGPIPAVYVPYQLGEQVLDYECGDTDCTSRHLQNVTLAHELEHFLHHSRFGKLANGAPVPATIARVGTYMHMLADRASHYWCTDTPATGVFGKDGQLGNYTSALDALDCNFVTHAMQHYWEQGVKTPLAPQSWAAITLYYDELSSFKKMPGAAHFFNGTAPQIAKQILIGDASTPGTLPIELMKRDVKERVGGLNRLIAAAGFAPIPGFEADCDSNPW